MCIEQITSAKPKNPNGWKVVEKTYNPRSYFPAYSRQGACISKDQMLIQNRWYSALHPRHGFHYWPTLNAARLQLASNLSKGFQNLVIVKVRARRLIHSGYCNASGKTTDCIAIGARGIMILEEVLTERLTAKEERRLQNNFRKRAFLRRQTK